VVGYMVFFVSSLPALALKGPGIPAWAKVRVHWNIQCSEKQVTLEYSHRELILSHHRKGQWCVCNCTACVYSVVSQVAGTHTCYSRML
jgi:hypothetical protein